MSKVFLQILHVNNLQQNFSKCFFKSTLNNLILYVQCSGFFFQNVKLYWMATYTPMQRHEWQVENVNGHGWHVF
jgi:hypothetical protein